MLSIPTTHTHTHTHTSHTHTHTHTHTPHTPPPHTHTHLTPHTHTQGFSGLYYTAAFFNTTNITFTSSSGWGHLTNNVDTFCNLSSEQATPFAKDQFFYMRCFSGYFMSFLLVEGFGFTEDRSWSVEFKLKVGLLHFFHLAHFVCTVTVGICTVLFFTLDVDLHPYTPPHTHTHTH